MVRYKLQQDVALRLSHAEEIEAHQRLARYGKWKKSWWTPNPSTLDAVAKIKREKFVIVAREDSLG